MKDLKIQSKAKRLFTKKLLPLWFLLPFLLLITAFFIIPAVLSLVMGFTNWDASFNPKFIGLQNFARILKDPYLGKIIGITLKFTIIGEIIVEGIAIFIAILTQFFVKNKLSRYVYRTVWLAMSALPSLVYVVVVKGVFGGTAESPLNAALLSMGLIKEPVLWLQSQALNVIILTDSFLNGAGGVILLSAAINSIPEDYFKAARVDGATEFGIVWQVIMPLLSWTIMYQVVSGLIGKFSGYGYIMLMTDGGPNRATTTLSLYSYQNAFSNLKYGYGSAVSIIVLLISAVLVFILFKMFNFDQMMKPPRIDD